MGCVNRNGKEFKDLASRHNLDLNALELIVHKYWLETGSEAFFPTDIYIQAQLGNTQYQEDGKNVRKLWQMKYSVPQEFSTSEEFQQAYDKATLYFPKSAIVYYKNGKGNFVLSVKKPVARLNYSKEDYLKDMNNMVAPKNGKTLNLDITEGQNYGIGKVRELYNKFNTDRTSQDLADRVFNLAKDLGINVSFTNDFSGEKLGRYNNEKGIAYKKSFLESDMMDDRKAPILLHEVLHAISMYAFSDNMEGIKLSIPMREFILEMNFLYQDLKNNPLLRNERGIVNLKEFVTELSNPIFRAKIQEIDKQNKGNESSWSRVLNAYKKLLGLHVTNNYYERSMNALDKALNAFDIDSYMRYTSMKDKLREKIANNNSNTQLNKSINVIKDAAVSGKWTAEALKELNNLTKDLEDGKIIYQRFPKEASRAYNQGGRANEIASILLGASNGTSKENPRSFAEKYERDKREQPIQERIIESWAKAEGIWYDKLDTIKGKRQIAEGGEAKVFYNGNEENVTKILSTEYFITPQLALDRITIHNILFPTASLKIIGFGRNSKGEFQFLVEQPFIQGEPATQEEIDRFITKAGFEKSKKDKGNTFISDDLYLSDLHDENVIKTPNGDLVVIDADLRLNTPDLNMEGKYEINDNIVSMKDADYNEFTKTLSEKQLRDELHLIRQEEADYDLVNGIEEKPQRKAERTGPQDFTFNDGTTIKAPFKPNEQQEEALNAMDDFIKSDDTSMTLSGYAGTGKTSLMEMIAKKCRKQGRPVMFCATTNKAAAVLNDKVSGAGFKATTLNKTFGINVEIDSSQKSYNARNLVNVLKDVDIMPGTTVIIDEASMINEEHYKILNKIAKDNNLKIIYVGDKAQLAPVNEDQISKVFRNGDGKVITLTQVERTDDNAILKEATNIRNGKPLSGETSFNSKGEGVAYISPQHQDAINEVVSHYVKELRKDPNYFRILAYTNKAVSDYNNQVRSLLGYDSPIPQVGEPMTGYANWGYDWRTKSYRFINSESYKVTKVGNPRNKSILLDDGRQVSLEAVPITLEDSLGHRDEFEFMDIKSNPQNRQAAMVLAEEKKKLWAMTKRVYGKAAKAELFQKINSLDSFLFVNDNLEDNDHNLLQAKTIDFGYALTIHKSQGSTFTNVLIDDVDISKSIRSNSSFDTVEIGDTALDPSNAKIESMETVDLGDLSNVVPESEETTPSSSTSNAANIKQQLEYVGVSRATDTVTIISNKIKKEGSPLHSESSNVRETLTPTPAPAKETNQGHSNEVTRQLTDHLKSMGINVFGRDAMQRFFEEHPGTLLQMARAFGKEMPYLNSEHREQIPEILNIVKANKYNKPGTDAVTLDSDNHKTIYLIDHSADKELADNLKKGDGFGIRAAFNVDKLSKDDCRTIIRNLSSDFGGSEATIRRKLQSLGITSEHLFGIDIAAELKMGTNANDSMVSSGKGKGFQTYNNRRGIDGRESKESSRQKDRVRNDGITKTQFSISSESSLAEEKYKTEEEYRQLAKEQDKIHNSLIHNILYEDSIATNNGEISIEQSVNDKENNEVSISSGSSVFNRVNVSIKANVDKNLIGGSVLFPTSAINDRENNYNRLDNPIKNYHAEILKAVLNHFIKSGHLHPASEWSLMSDNSEYNYKGRVDTLSTALGVDVSSCFMYKMRQSPQWGEGTAEERVTVDAKKLAGMLPSLGTSDITLKIDKALSDTEQNKVNYSLQRKALENQYKSIEEKRRNLWTKIKNLDEQIKTQRLEDDDLPFFRTPQGEVYGFVDKDGNIYLDETQISPEHPIHEYTHLWDRAVAKHNPELWNRGVELMKRTPLWNDVLNDESYGKRWQGIKGMTSEKMDSLIASEIHARLTGEKGAEILDKLVKEKGQSSIVAKLKQWILDVWKDLKNTFSPWTKSELEKLTLDDFNNMAVRDFTKGINPLDAVAINSTEGTANDPQRFNNAIQSKNVIESDHTILSNDELKYWNEQGVGEMPRIISASEHSDPAFHVGEILSVIEGKRNLYTWDHKTLTGKDFAGMYIITKHDGLPMRRLLETKIPKLIHFSITGLGGTEYEPGVMKYNDLLDRIQEYIEQGLDPKCVTIRIDPIIPGITKNSDIETIVKRASEMGIKRIRFSVMDAYTNTVAAISKLGYDFETYYGRKANGEANFHAKYEVLNSVADFMLSLKEKYGVTMGTCAEPMVREGISKEGCLSVAAVNNLLGTHIIDKDKENNKSRYQCTCYGGKVDALKYGAHCASHCIYCYARHENDRAMEYYNEDGTLKDNNFTRTQWPSAKDISSLNTNDTSSKSVNNVPTFDDTSKSYSWASKSDNSYEVSTAGDKRFSAFNATFKPNTTVQGLDVSGMSIENAYQNVFKRSGKGLRPAADSFLNVNRYRGYFEGSAPLRQGYPMVPVKLVSALADYFIDGEKLTNENYEDFSYYMVYLPLWKEWAKQNPQLMEELKTKAQGKVLTDKFANTSVSQARALADILNADTKNTRQQQDNSEQNHKMEQPENDVKQEEKVENPTFEQGKTFTVKLPSYEYFNDLYEDSTVDAEWKIPYLQKLDSQLSNGNTAEENQDILNQMNTIMDATSEKEYNQQLKDPKGVKKTLGEYERFIQQLDNLLEGGNEDYEELGVKISASEVRHTAELIINEVSDEITRLQTEEGRAKEIFPEIKTKIDFKTATRRQIVDAIGINTLLDRVKNLFDSETAMYDADETSLQADLITENWDAFITMAADVFALNEGFGITKDYSKGNFTTTDEAKADFDNFNDYSNDPDVVAEEGEKDEQEHWQVEMKTIDVLNSMSDLVRQGLRECYLLDEDGEKVMSKWGIAERVNPRKATNSILRWTQGSMSLDDMVTKLSDKSTKNPWLSQLVEKLSDKSGKYTDFQSQFYGVFQKHFQPYSIVVTENGKYHSMWVNSHPALSDAMRTITSKFKTQTHPLFIGNRIKKEALGNDSTTDDKHDFNLHKALSELQGIVKSLSEGNILDEDMSNKAKENILGVCQLMGYDITEDALSDIINEPTIKKEAEYLQYMVKALDKAYEAQHQGKLQDYNPFAYGVKNGIDGSLRNFLTPITDVMEDTAVSAFYDSGKMYQSYVTPSFMTKLMNKFKLTGQEFRDFMMNEYASSEWFAFDKFGDYNRIQWRNEWLRQLQNEDARKVFSHKVELNFNKHNYMRNMTDAEYTISLITEYFSESTDRTKSRVPAWFRIPMQSNKPSSDFIRFYSYRGSVYKDSITDNLYEMFLQELSRIQTVRMRNLNKKDAGFIKNFDTNGRKFNFLPVFNAYLENTPTALAARNRLHNTVEYDETRLMELQLRFEEWERGDILGTFKDADEYYDLMDKKEANDRALTTEEDARFATLLQKKLNGEEALTSVEEAQLGKLALKIIRQSMENRVQSILDSWEASGILESAKDIKDIYPASLDDEGAAKYVRSQVENFLWNDALASKNILQLTIGDIAFYKDTEDLQKRLAQLHAPGMRGNIYATDYKGNRVSDGKYRTFILNDFDTFKSNLIANISEVFDRKIAAASNDQKSVMVALKESLVGADGKYTHINVTDAQGYSSPTSYRKKAFIFGRWSHQAEDIYQKLKNGEYTFSDLETAFQPLKPFVYTKLTKNMGVDNAPIHSVQVPFQAKNAEYLLIMADALLQGEELSRPNLLRAVYRVMEDSDTINPTMGIDTVQFESAIKSGLQGTINISQFMDMPNGEEAAYTYMKNLIYKDGSTEYNKDVFVHETSFDDYCIQQEVPEHFKEHSQAHGSQIRMITPSDLDFYTNDVDKDGNPVDNYYEWKEPDGTIKRLKADEFRKEYEQTIANNIEDSIHSLEAELHLDSEDKKERNIALSKILIKEILSSPRYGVDLMQACSLNEDGEFRIPKGDPIQAKRIEQLINSIIKNRVNKQKIAGGPIVQVSNFGTSKQLHIRFNDKQGNLLPMESEYVPSEHDNLSYKDYIKENQGGIAYFEVFAPIWSNEIFDKFSNPDGSINIDAINATDPELLKMVSYRIPTEDKYSCAPMKVVGFMPREAGDAIMLPYELTEIDDSDFDVDKRYIMRKDIPIKTKEAGEYVDQLIETGKKLYKKIMGTEATAGSVAIGDKGDYVEKMVDSLVKNPIKFPKNSPFRKALYSEYQKLAYKTEAPTSGRGYRDNKIIDMTYAVLTNEMTADKILNPGGFDAPKKMGYMVAAYKNHANEGIKWSDLEGMSIDELKKLSYTDKDLTFADTQVQFYKQNAASSSMIGVFAVNKVAHAILESNGIYLDVAEVCGEKPFTIAGTTFEGKMEIDMKYDQNRTLIGKTLGSLVSASADAVKDPILNLMNINMTTAGMLNTMLRFGMPFNDAALFLSQDIIERLLTQFNRENLTNYVSLDSLVTKWLDKYREQNDITDSSALNTEPLTRDELIEGLKSSEHEKIDYKVLLAFQKMRILTDFMRKPTFATRFNSISSAVGPLIIDNLIMEHKRDAFKGDTSDTHFYTLDSSNVWVPYSINDTFQAHPVLAKFAETLDIAKGMFMDMPTGSNGFRGLLNKLPKDIQDKMYGDKKLMDQFSNFYQSYLLIQSGVVDPSRLSYYIKDFPMKFMAEKWNEKYPDNPLIQAIRMNVDSKSKNPYLIINITGMDEQQKGELKYGWIDLYKVEPQLSQDLFNYSFFRAGIGFSPKTFMALVPTYVKERLKGADNQSSYVNTYRNFPEVVPDLVIDQFIRNNWSNNKLAPWKGGKNTHYLMDEKKGTLLVSRAEEIKDVKDFSYIKTSKNKVAYLWHQEGQTTDGILFRRVKPLGNNGEYMEMSTSEITNPMSATVEASNDTTPSPIKETSPEESNVEETPTPVTSDTQEAKNLSELADLIMKQVPKLNKEQALSKIEEIKGNVRLYRKFLQNVFKQKGLILDENEAINEFNKYC